MEDEVWLMFANENSKLAWDITLLVHCLSSMHDTQIVVAHIDNFRILGGEGKINRRNLLIRLCIVSFF